MIPATTAQMTYMPADTPPRADAETARGAPLSNPANNNERVRLCCPYCKGALDPGDAEQWRCLGCRRSFPVDGGIPDLRTFETYYGSRERERPAVRALLAAYPTATFADLIRVRFGPDYPMPADLRRALRQLSAGERQARRRPGSLRQHNTSPRRAKRCRRAVRRWRSAAAAAAWWLPWRVTSRRWRGSTSTWWICCSPRSWPRNMD